MIGGSHVRQNRSLLLTVRLHHDWLHDWGIDMSEPNDCASDGAYCWFQSCKQDGCLYHRGKMKPNYPMPAIPMRVEYIFGHGLADGIFIRVEDYIVCGAYRDGLLVEGYPAIPYEYDYPDTD